MNSFRQHLLSLPFVSERADGTLDYWSVATTGHRETDIEIGRGHAARCIHFYREFQCPQIAAHIVAEWVASAPECQGHIRFGFTSEALSALTKAPEGATPGLLVASQALKVMDVDDFCRLPFVGRNADGGLDGWAVTSSGDWAEDNAAGRHYGALAAQVVRLSGSLDIIWLILAGLSAPGRLDATRGVLTGFMTEIASIQMASCPQSTPHQQAALPLHKHALAAA